MAQVLAEHLQSVMDCTPKSSDVMSGFGVNGDVANGSFEEVAPFGGFGWRYSTVDSGIDRIYSPDDAHDGNYYLRLNSGKNVHQPNPAVDGQVVTVTIWMRGALGGAQAKITIDFRDQEMWTAPLQTDSVDIYLTTSWQSYTVTATAPTGGVKPVYHTRLTLQATSGDYVDVDGVLMSVNDPVCGNGVCENGKNSSNCETDCPPTECGDGNCDPGEDQCNCASDCGAPPAAETNCSDGINEDCDTYTDCDDSDCKSYPACDCITKGEWCSNNKNCCSNDCRGKKCK